MLFYHLEHFSNKFLQLFSGVSQFASNTTFSIILGHKSFELHTKVYYWIKAQKGSANWYSKNADICIKLRLLQD